MKWELVGPQSPQSIRLMRKRTLMEIPLAYRACAAYAHRAASDWRLFAEGADVDFGDVSVV